MAAVRGCAAMPGICCRKRPRMSVVRPLHGSTASQAIGSFIQGGSNPCCLGGLHVELELQSVQRSELRAQTQGHSCLLLTVRCKLLKA